MIATLLEFFREGAAAMWDAAVGLALPALYFVTLAVILKRKTLIADIVRVRKESELNLQIMVFDVFFVLPMIAVVAGRLNEMIVNRGYAIFSPDYLDRRADICHDCP